MPGKHAHRVHTMQLIEMAMDGKLETIKTAEFIDTDGEDIGIGSSDICFSDVSFGYGRKRVLDGVSFRIL